MTDTQTWMVWKYAFLAAFWLGFFAGGYGPLVAVTGLLHLYCFRRQLDEVEW